MDNTPAATSTAGEDWTVTKLGHSCIRVHRADRTLVLDPGNFTDAAAALDGAQHILVTHEHADHLDDQPVLQHLTAHPDVHLHAPQAAARRLREAADQEDVRSRVHDVGPGQHLEAAGFSVHTVGGNHAEIHREIPRVDNVGYVIDGVLYHPGDSFDTPGAHRPHTVLVPLNAPWAKVSESIDFLRLMGARGARQLIPVHDGLLAQTGQGIYLKLTGGFAQQDELNLTVLAPGEQTRIPAEAAPEASA